MAAMTEAEMMAALALDSSDSDSDGNAGGGSIIAPAATEQPVNLNRVENGMQIKLWRRVISFLSVCEQTVSVRGMSHFFRQCSNAYMQKFWSEPILHMPQDAPSLARLMELVQRLMEEEGYVEGTTVMVALGSGVHEVVGSWVDPEDGEVMQKMLSVPCNNLSFVGQGEGVTIVEGGLVVENGRKVSVEGLTMKNASGYGVFASGAGTEVVLKKMTVEECQQTGVYVINGAKLVATECHFHQNGVHGVFVGGSTTTARLTNCTSHHNRLDGVDAHSGAVVDLMGEQTSVHDNERHGLIAFFGGSINVYQPCVLNDMSHGNKRQNIYRSDGGRVQQKDSKK